MQLVINDKFKPKCALKRVFKDPVSWQLLIVKNAEGMLEKQLPVHLGQMRI